MSRIPSLLNLFPLNRQRSRKFASDGDISDVATCKSDLRVLVIELINEQLYVSLELVHVRRILSMYLFQSLGAEDAWDSQLFLNDQDSRSVSKEDT